MKKKQYAWHFLSDKDGHPVYRDGKPAKIGDVLTHDGPLVACESGLHYSRRPIDALRYAPSPWLCRVKIDGAEDQHTDKGVCRRREIVWMADVSPILRAFARWCAWTVIDEWDAPDIVRRYLLTGYESIRAAAEDAARAATCAAARDAAWAAARAAVEDAAWAAARAATCAAAGDAAGDAQNEMLEYAFGIAGALAEEGK